MGRVGLIADLESMDPQICGVAPAYLPLKVELRGGQCFTALPAIVVGSVFPRPLIAATCNVIFRVMDDECLTSDMFSRQLCTKSVQILSNISLDEFNEIYLISFYKLNQT